MKHYHNTTQETTNLSNYEEKAKSQDQLIYEWFLDHRGSVFTPSFLHSSLALPLGTPITSVRRALTNLTKAGKLIKTDHKVEGMHGRDEHCWALRYEILR
jgi:hypothetical protein